MKSYQISDIDFIKKYKNITHFSFEFTDKGNDEFNPCGTIKKQCTYEFYIHTDLGKDLLVYKNHRRISFDVEQELLKKYKNLINKTI